MTFRDHPVPPGRPVMRMHWSSLLFAHWPVPVSTLRPLVPSVMDVDTFDGMAWIGLVPFAMSGVRPNGLPGVPWLSAFPEMNVRTYVRPAGVRGTAEDRPGVYFFSLDCHQPIAVTMARTFFHLNYVHAAMTMQVDDDGTVHYSSRRTDRAAPAATFVGRYRSTGTFATPERGTLDDFLTRRACLYVSDRRGRLMRGEIDHDPWELASAEWDVDEESALSAAGVSVDGDAPRLAAARPLDVRAWRIRPVTAPLSPESQRAPVLAGGQMSVSPMTPMTPVPAVQAVPANGRLAAGGLANRGVNRARCPSETGPAVQKFDVNGVER